MLRGTLLLAVLALAAPAGAVCGDGHIDPGEECDGADVGGKTCADLTAGFVEGGSVGCNADCTYDLGECRRLFIDALAPASAAARRNRCHLEWGTVGTTALRRPTRRSCIDGTDGCDQDRAHNRECLIRVELCLNVPDPRVTGCEPATIVRLAVLRPTAASAELAGGVVTAATNAAPDRAHANGSTIDFSPPVTEFSCGTALVRVPLKGTSAHPRPGKAVLRARTSNDTGRGRATSALELICLP